MYWTSQSNSTLMNDFEKFSRENFGAVSHCLLIFSFSGCLAPCARCMIVVHVFMDWLSGSMDHWLTIEVSPPWTLLMILKSNLEIAHMTVKQEDNGTR